MPTEITRITKITEERKKTIKDYEKVLKNNRNIIADKDKEIKEYEKKTKKYWENKYWKR